MLSPTKQKTRKSKVEAGATAATGRACPYHVAEYRDPETGRTRWAVLHLGTGVFYFASRYGHDAAERLPNRMSKEAV